MSTRTQVLQILADGRFHSGTEMGQSLGISRAAINKCIKSLADVGLEIHRVSGRGYRLAQACTPLRPDVIRQQLHDCGAIRAVHVLDEVDSTSQYLMRLAQQQDVSGHVCLAECQRQGRGRRGRQWLATPYSNIMLSMAWRFPYGAAQLTGLSLAAGVAALQALEQLGVSGVGLKWPNDLLWQQQRQQGTRTAKLGGILVDIHGEAEGPCLATIGIGINVSVDPGTSNAIDQDWMDLAQIMDQIPDRNHLAALLIERLATMLQDFERNGFVPYREAWQQRHLYGGRPVRVLLGEQEYIGEAVGVDRHGALLLRDSSGKQQVFHAGEVSLRQAS